MHMYKHVLLSNKQRQKGRLLTKKRTKNRRERGLIWLIEDDFFKKE